MRLSSPALMRYRPDGFDLRKNRINVGIAIGVVSVIVRDLVDGGIAPIAPLVSERLA